MSVVTITAAVRPSARAALVSITVTGAAVGETMTVRRYVGTDPAVTVMGAGQLAASSCVLVDPEAPMNLTASWQVVTSTGSTATSAALTVPAELATIADPVRGIVVDCAVIDRDQISRPNRAEVLQVESDPTPHVVWDVPAASQMPIQLLTLTSDAAADMVRLLDTGDQLLLRCVCTHHDDVWIQPVGSETSHAPVVARSESTMRTHNLGDCVIYPTNPRIAKLALANTLGNVDAAVTPKTLGAIASRWATLGAIAEADLAS